LTGGLSKTMNLFGQAETGIEVNAKELAEWLGVTPSAVTQLKAAGKIVPTPSGKFDLKATVAAYCRDLRARRGPSESKDLSEQLLFWRVENAKTANARWRVEYGRRLIAAYVTHHGKSLAAFRDAIGGHAESMEAALRLAAAVSATDPEAILGEVTEDELPAEVENAEE